MSTKALAPQQNEAIRALLRGILDRDFEGNKTHAARGLGVSQSMVSETLKGTRGAGSTLLRALADYTGKTVDELMGRPRQRTIEYDPGQRSDIPATALGNHREWVETRAEYERIYGDGQREQLDELEGAQLSHPPEVISVEFIRRLIDVVEQAKADVAKRKAERAALAEARARGAANGPPSAPANDAPPAPPGPEGAASPKRGGKGRG